MYDIKDQKDDKVKTLLSNERVICIGASNVGNNLSVKYRASFKESKWIELTDRRSNRSFSKKYPLLNSSLFTKKNTLDEIQRQTLLGKFNTHEYYSTNTAYTTDHGNSGAEKLRKKILSFFSHYRSAEAKDKYEVLKSQVLEEELS